MNRRGLAVAMVMLTAACSKAHSGPENADAGTRRPPDAAVDGETPQPPDPASLCGRDGGPPCCGEELLGVPDPGPVFLPEISTSVITGELGTGTLDSVEPAPADATHDGICTNGLLPRFSYQCRSSWSLTMDTGATTRVESSLPVEDVSWLVGQPLRLAAGLVYDEAGRLVIWQFNGESYVAADVVPLTPEASTPLPFSLSVRMNSEDVFCRVWSSPCWMHDVYLLDVMVNGTLHRLGPGESFEFVADGLRYRVTDRLLVSRSPTLAAQCADAGRETWSFDVVALGPAG